MTEISVETDWGLDVSKNPSAPAINYMPNVEFNYGITIKVTKTMSNTTYPRPIRFGIYGCGTPSTLGTKAQIEDSRMRR